jgi:hypothetical protein
MLPLDSQCQFCKHLLPAETDKRIHCAAYPDGISKRVLFNEVSHAESLPGDNGVQFEARDRRAWARALRRGAMADTARE